MFQCPALFDFALYRFQADFWIAGRLGWMFIGGCGGQSNSFRIYFEVKCSREGEGETHPIEETARS